MACPKAGGRVRACTDGIGQEAFFHFCRRAAGAGQRIELSVKVEAREAQSRFRLIWGGNPTVESVAASCSILADVGVRGRDCKVLLGMMEAITSPTASRIMVAFESEGAAPRIKLYASLGRTTERSYARWRKFFPSLPGHRPRRVSRLMVACSITGRRAQDRAYLFFRRSALRSSVAPWLRATLGAGGAALAAKHQSFVLGFKSDSCDMVSLSARSFDGSPDHAAKRAIAPWVARIHEQVVPWLPRPMERLTWVGLPFPQTQADAGSSPREINAYWDVSDLVRV